MGSSRNGASSTIAPKAKTPAVVENNKSANGKHAVKAERQPKVVVWNKFKNLLPPQTEEARALLKESLRKEGCRDAIVVWKKDGERVVIEGHNRLEICKEENILYKIHEVELADEEAAYNWIIKNQLGRRNLTPEEIGYLRGRRYNTEKQSHGGDRKSEESSGKECHSKTDERLAEEYEVAAKTIRNDGAFAAALDTLVENCGEKVKEDVLRDRKIPRNKVIELGDLPSEKQEDAVQKALEGKKVPRNGKPKQQDAAKSDTKEKNTITLPATVAACAKSLVRLKGRVFARQVIKALEKFLEENDGRRQKGKGRRAAAED